MQSSNTPTPVDYTIVPIHAEFLETARQQHVDDQLQPVERHIATGGEPCRDVLRRAIPGDAILLASYSPFIVASPYKEFGPVYVMARSEPQAELPTSLAGLASQGYLGEQFVLRAYSQTERIVDGMVVTQANAEACLQTMLRRKDVAFVLARFAGYGCYACRIQRV